MGADVGDDVTRHVGECTLRVYSTFPKDDQVETAASCPNPDVAVGHRGGGGFDQVSHLYGDPLVACRKDGCHQEWMDLVVVVFRRSGSHPVRSSAGCWTG